MMNTAEWVESLDALPEKTRLGIERLVLLLRQQATKTSSRQPPIMRPADPAQAGEPFNDPAYFGAWADRADITDGAEYIHQVRRGLRPA